jgi:hypothetical protein
MLDPSSYLYSYARYRGKFSLQNLLFNANLQEFAQEASYIASLETAGKLSADAAYQQLEVLWEALQNSRPDRQH